MAVMNVGNILEQSARTRGLRSQNALRQQQTGQDENQRVNDILYRAHKQTYDNPQFAQEIDNKLKSEGIIGQNFTRDYNNLEEIKLNSFKGMKSTEAFTSRTTSPNRLGKYNPGDYTPESFSQFIGAGGQDTNANLLKRYESPTVRKVGGVQSLVGRSGGGGDVSALGTLEAETGATQALSGAKEQGKQDVLLETRPKLEAEIVKSKFEAQKQTQKPKAITGATTERQKQVRLKSLIAKAKSQANAWTTGFLGDKLKDIAGTPAFDLSQTLSTLQANAGFDRLQEMRDNSKTGGALGQVSERELALLINAYQAITQSQSKKQLIENLTAFEKQLDQTWARVNMAYELDYGEKYEGQAIEPQPEEIINWEDL